VSLAQDLDSGVPPVKFRRTVLLMIACSLSLLALRPRDEYRSPVAKCEGGQPALGSHRAAQRILARPLVSFGRQLQCGGAYSESSGSVQGLLLSEVKGVWRTPTRLVPPSRADADPSLTINALSCATTGNCAAVGSFEDTHSNGQSFVADEVNGVWKGAQEVNLPSNAGASVQNSEVHSVDCWSPGNCSAIGSYLDDTTPTGYAQGLEVNEVRGVWGRAQETALPPDTNVDPYVDINQVACTHAGNCVAVGSYISQDNATEGLIITEVNGAWKSATAAVLPATPAPTRVHY